MNKITTQAELKEAGKRGREILYPRRTKITVGLSTCGIASGAESVYQALVEKVDNLGLDIAVSRTGCIGLCQEEPLVELLEPGKPKITYGKMTPQKVRTLISNLGHDDGLQKEDAVWRTDEDDMIITGEKVRFLTGDRPDPYAEIPLFQERSFFQKQLRIILRNCGLIDPENIEEYIARGGYQALWKVLHALSPEEVITVVKDSGIRGRGGAGFPTGRKWEDGRSQPGEVKYVIVNADEGDPGAFMDRSILEGDPYSVLEGLTIGAYAVGSVSEGYIYVRAEYPLAIKKLRTAIARAEELGFLGENILGSGFNLKVYIVEGAGAFVCGESSALMASIEGRVGEPRLKPPRSVVKGLWGRPTVLNNVKTWASIPPIIARGSDWYASIGTDANRGTTVFALTGKVRYNGLAEVPLGIRLRDMIFEIGGGIQSDKKFKAVQTGGPSGGCLPESKLDLPVDFERLQEAGSMMGSGGMIVVDDEACMVDVARFFLDFTKDESCGRCVPCREGTIRVLDILTNIVQGRGRLGDIELLEELSSMIAQTSICGLGQTAPNPVLSTIRYFRDEYEAHIQDKRCPAGVCRALIEYSIIPERCTGCGACLKQCPNDCITGEPKKPHVLDPANCIKCGACKDVCKFDAIMIQ
ncbi:NADH-ubiquinone oxidoreductase-F iron-sulfur binding region domain-containing protein [Planctomycetota bacterium]